MIEGLLKKQRSQYTLSADQKQLILRTLPKILILLKAVS